MYVCTDIILVLVNKQTNISPVTMGTGGEHDRHKRTQYGYYSTYSWEFFNKYFESTRYVVFVIRIPHRIPFGFLIDCKTDPGDTDEYL